MYLFGVSMASDPENHDFALKNPQKSSRTYDYFPRILLRRHFIAYAHFRIRHAAHNEDDDTRSAAFVARRVDPDARRRSGRCNFVYEHWHIQSWKYFCCFFKTAHFTLHVKIRFVAHSKKKDQIPVNAPSRRLGTTAATGRTSGQKGEVLLVELIVDGVLDEILQYGRIT